MKEMELKVRSATKAATAAKAELTQCQHRRDVASAEILSMDKELNALREQVVSSSGHIIAIVAFVVMLIFAVM